MDQGSTADDDVAKSTRADSRLEQSIAGADDGDGLIRRQARHAGDLHGLIAEIIGIIHAEKLDLPPWVHQVIGKNPDPANLHISAMLRRPTLGLEEFATGAGNPATSIKWRTRISKTDSKQC